jgi:hypothetical protein
MQGKLCQQRSNIFGFSARSRRTLRRQLRTRGNINWSGFGFKQQPGGWLKQLKIPITDKKHRQISIQRRAQGLYNIYWL